jgi:hypothetical protein
VWRTVGAPSSTAEVQPSRERDEQSERPSIKEALTGRAVRWARQCPPDVRQFGLALPACQSRVHHIRRTQEAIIDYDSPRRPPIEDDDGLAELKVREAARSPTADLDDVETAELPGADIFGEELTVPVVPMRGDELRCSRCFLVQHRSRFAARVEDQEICLECS